MPSTDTDVLTLTSPRDLLAAVPFRLGFRPQRSLVLLELAARPAVSDAGAAAGTSPPLVLGVCVRVDIPLHIRDVAGLAEAATAPWRRAVAAPCVVTVLYDDSPGAPGRLATALQHACEQSLTDSHVEVRDAFLVDADRWRSLRCSGDDGCCPGRGGPLAQLQQGAVPAEAVLRGLVARDHREDLLPDLTPVSRQRLRQARAAERAVLARTFNPVRRATALALWRRERQLYQSPARVQLPDAAVCGQLLAAIRDLPVRDAVLLDPIEGPAATRTQVGLLAGRGPHELRDMAGALREPPDRQRASAATRLAIDLARHGDSCGAAAALAVAGWLSWTVGDGVQAAGCVEAALARDSRHSLALLVARALASGLSPAWRTDAGQSR